jgi:diguanylate cyclase (GGDEF)-like protein
LDQFKKINNSLGHQTGDEVLKAAAKGIQEATRGTDLVFRGGGDEIWVVLSKTTPEGLLIAAERIRMAVHKIGEIFHCDLEVSIGVAVYPEHGHQLEELMLVAGLALYLAKDGTEKIHVGSTKYTLDENSIKVVFQPILDVRSKAILGYEALSRDPEGNFNILELFKRYKTIGRLNELKKICFNAQLKAAKEIGLKKVFINVDFKLLAELEAVPRPPPGMDVILEISELEAIHNIDDHLNIAKEWREKGYKFAIDDFGAGFISLPFMAQLTPEYIKIDRSTILHAVYSESFRGFLKNLVQGLKNFTTGGIIAEGIETVAEGIETERELLVVKEIGVDLAQGFSLGKPQELR